MLVCNNACWAMGEIALKVPEKVKLSLIEVINTLADILNSDILNQLLNKSENEIFRHFAKTISITLGRLGRIDP